MSLSIARRPAATPMAPLGASEPHMKVGARWRRGIVGAVTTLLLAALIGPAVAGAVPPQEIDDLGNTGNDTTIEVDDPDGEGTIVINTAGDATPPSTHSCSYTVKGHLVVRNPTVDGLVDNDPLEDVEVKVSGRSEFGSWNEWDTEQTDQNGDFSVWKPECGDRKIKVEARFKSDDLRVTSSSSKDWYLLRETVGTISPSTLDIGDEPFGGESGDQSTSQARTDAQTWIVYRKAFDYAASIGHRFLDRTTVHNPATWAPNGSWADPILHDIHIAPADTASIDDMLHEGGHIWAYPRSIGEGCLTSAVLADGSPHDQQETPCAAIHEGFGSFFANKIEQEMNTAGLIASTESPLGTTPHGTIEMKRSELTGRGLVSLHSVARNEAGWDQVFRVLTSPDITRHVFGPGYGNPGNVGGYWGAGCSGMPAGQDDLADALRAFGDTQNQYDLQDSQEPSVSDFFYHAAERLPGFDDFDAIAYTNAVDPTLDSEPHEAYGC